MAKKPKDKKSKSKDKEKVEKKSTKKGKIKSKDKEGKGKKSKKSKPEKVKGKKSKKSKRTDEDDSEDDEPKPKKSKIKEAAKNEFNPYVNLDESLDKLEKTLALAGSSLNINEQRQTSGLLVMDLLITLGLAPGWYTFLGPEQSCKSTASMAVLCASLISKVPILYYWDYEGSGEPNYIENMMKTNGVNMSIEQVFGERDPKTSQYIVKPRVRYQKPQVAEKFFDALFRLERQLPDKVNVGKDWFYVYENTNENRKIVGQRYDKKYFHKFNKFRVPAPDGALQALFVVDSYPSMLPNRLDDEDAGTGMAEQARMFSEQLKRVKGNLASKRICVVGVNQLRQRPMVKYGSPEYEPCGEAIKFYSDCRVQLKPRAISTTPYARGKGNMEEEDSVTTDGTDTYRYLHARVIKNKMGPAYREGYIRLWITDGNQEARGFDPVWDTFMYLDMTGQVEHIKRTKILLKLKGRDRKKNKTIDWYDFKRLVLGTSKEQKAIYEKLGMKPIDLRSWAKRQLAEKDGMDLYLADRKRLAKKGKMKADAKEAREAGGDESDGDKE